MDLYQETGKEKYNLAVELLLCQLKEQPRTEEGSFWHKKIYPHQVWLDGLGGDGVRRDGSYEYYISEPIVENDGKGMVPFVLTYTELS